MAEWERTGGLWRRRAVLGGIAGLGVLATGPGFGQGVVVDDKALVPGEFSWHPERSPQGPIAIIVSLPEQLVHVYRNGVRIAVSTCSTGKPGHETPTGVFTILQKDKDHHSSTYNDAAMPNMNRLTWDGIALHAGNLPGYPASHGCVRLPMAFSENLFGLTLVGTPVIIAGAASDPWELTHPGLVLANGAEAELATAVDALDGKAHPADWTEGAEYPVTTVIATAADRRIVLLVDGEDVVEDTLSVAGDGPLGEHVCVLKEADAGVGGPAGLRWIGLTYHPDATGAPDPDESVLNRLTAPPVFRAEMAKRAHPGMMMIVSDLDAHPDRRSGEDLVLMTSGVFDAAPPAERPRQQG